MIHERSGTMYDPTIADAFMRIVQRLRTAPVKDGAGRAQTRVDSLWLEARAV
jgi:hypothetical protein